jgi:peroxiredoxin Q/BCP
MNANESIPAIDSTPVPPPPVSRAALAFSLVLFVIGCVFLGIALRRLWFPKENPAEMRKVNVAEEAKELLRKEKPTPLSEPLEEILQRAEQVHFDSQPHPLLGKAAPDFVRPDADGNRWAPKEATQKGPVVVVFYLGYYCNHCVSQLFDLNEDLALFRELGAQVVALSPDSAETTLKRYKEYGRFSFPLLSDHDNRIAQAYGVFTPAKDDKREKLEHGTFIIDQQGIVRWAAFGETPFGHNKTLLYELAKLRKKD